MNKEDKNKLNNNNNEPINFCSIILKIIIVIAVILYFYLDNHISTLNNTINELNQKISYLEEFTGRSVENSKIVYITNTGSKYHKSGCSYLKSKISIDKDEAIRLGYTPCSRCSP